MEMMAIMGVSGCLFQRQGWTSILGGSSFPSLAQARPAKTLLSHLSIFISFDSLLRIFTVPKKKKKEMSVAF